MNRVLLGSYDWNHLAWSQTYYPHDMPDDWRLPYYANRFYTTVFDIAALAITLGIKPVMRQLQDCHESFSPVVRVQSGVVDPLQMEEWIAALRDAEVIPTGIWFSSDMDDMQTINWQDYLVGQRVACSDNRRSFDLTAKHRVCCSWQA